MNTKMFMAASVAALLFATSATAQATMTVTNDGEVAIVGLAISGESSDDFGDNLLDEEIAPGEGVEVTFDVGDDCVQDVQATYEDGDTEEVMGVDLCSGDGFEVEDEDGSGEDEGDEDGDEEEEE